MIIIPVLIACLVAIIYSFWMLRRNTKVAAFRLQINDLCYRWSSDRVPQMARGEETSAYYWLWAKMPSYEKMLFSIKPLKLKNWLTEEQLKKLTNNDL